MSDLAQTYLRAADVIRTNGLYQGHYWGRPEAAVGIELSISECPVCAAGALSVALYDCPVPFVGGDPDPDFPEFLSPEFEQAVTGLLASAGIHGDPEWTVLGQLANWNDDPERTAAHVIAAFEAAAKQVA